MDEHKSVEEWANDLLEQHRTAPPVGAAPGVGRPESASVEDDPPEVRLLIKLSGEAPDPCMLERLRRSRERHAAFAKVEAVAQVIGTIVLFAPA